MDRIFEKFRKFYTSYVFEDFFLEENGMILESTEKCKKLFFTLSADVRPPSLNVIKID